MHHQVRISMYMHALRGEEPLAEEPQDVDCQRQHDRREQSRAEESRSDAFWIERGRIQRRGRRRLAGDRWADCRDAAEEECMRKRCAKRHGSKRSLPAWKATPASGCRCLRIAFTRNWLTAKSMPSLNQAGAWPTRSAERHGARSDGGTRMRSKTVIAAEPMVAARTVSQSAPEAVADLPDRTHRVRAHAAVTSGTVRPTSWLSRTRSKPIRIAWYHRIVVANGGAKEGDEGRRKQDPSLAAARGVRDHRGDYSKQHEYAHGRQRDDGAIGDASGQPRGDGLTPGSGDLLDHHAGCAKRGECRDHRGQRDPKYICAVLLDAERTREQETRHERQGGSQNAKDEDQGGAHAHGRGESLTPQVKRSRQEQPRLVARSSR